MHYNTHIVKLFYQKTIIITDNSGKKYLFRVCISKYNRLFSSSGCTNVGVLVKDYLCVLKRLVQTKNYILSSFYRCHKSKNCISILRVVHFLKFYLYEPLRYTLGEKTIIFQKSRLWLSLKYYLEYFLIPRCIVTLQQILYRLIPWIFRYSVLMCINRKHIIKRTYIRTYNIIKRN